MAELWQYNYNAAAATACVTLCVPAQTQFQNKSLFFFFVGRPYTALELT